MAIRISPMHDGNTDIIVDEYEAHIVRKVFELYATGAYSMDLLRAKVKKEYGVGLGQGLSLVRCLIIISYYGIMIVKGKSYPHRYPTIISQTLFEQVQQVKARFQ